MSPGDAALLRALLERPRTLALGVLVDGAPYVGLLPFARTGDGRALVIHASALARHTRGLAAGAPWSALLHLPEAEAEDPLQVPRVSFQGAIEPLERGTAAYDDARARYLARFPDAAPTFELADFELYALRITEGRLVAGFARARNVAPGDLASIT